MAETVLELRGLCKEYPAFRLKDVGFSVARGHIMGFIGRNGAGKTTTLKSMLNIVHPDAGEVKFFGLDFAEHEQEIKRRIAFVSGGANKTGTRRPTGAISPSLPWMRARRPGRSRRACRSSTRWPWRSATGRSC